MMASLYQSGSRFTAFSRIGVLRRPGRALLVHARLNRREPFGFLERDRALVPPVREVEDQTGPKPDEKPEPNEREPAP